MENINYLNQFQKSLYKWLLICIINICILLAAYLFFTEKLIESNKRDYLLLNLLIISSISISIFFYIINKIKISVILFIFTCLIGSWASLIFDPSIGNGNLIPIVYISLPILFSSFFTSPKFTLIIGIIQVIGLSIFFLKHYEQNISAFSSLIFYILFILIFSILYSYQIKNSNLILKNQVNKLEKLSILDPLTNLYNRRYLNEFLINKFESHKLNNNLLSIILIDLDNFKEYNDLYGHDYGDKILINFSKMLCSVFRKSDIISRFGGDEFCIIMNNSNIFEAKIKCQKLQESLVENQLIINEKINTPLTISIGISQNTIQTFSSKDLIKNADLALYSAKEGGKNRIKLYGY